MAYLLLALTIAGSTLVWQRVAARDGRIKVSVQHNQQEGRLVFDIQLQGFVNATPQQTWAVLTDYARLPEFVPDLLSSTLLSRNACETIIEQRGRAGFLFMKQAVHMVVRVTEQPFSTLDVALISGNMKHYTSHWALAPVSAPGGTRIDYQGSLEPDFYVPLLLGRVLVRRDTRKMLRAVLGEIERRAA